MSRSVPSSLNASLTTSHFFTSPLNAFMVVRMCVRMIVRSSAAVKVPLFTQLGSWLCQTSVWP